MIKQSKDIWGSCGIVLYIVITNVLVFLVFWCPFSDPASARAKYTHTCTYRYYNSTRVRTRVRTRVLVLEYVLSRFRRACVCCCTKIGALEARAGDAHGCAVDVMASDATSDARGQHGGARPPRSSRRGPDKAKQRQLPALVFRLVPSTWVFRWFLVQCQPTSLVAPRMRGSGP